ncbi:uncharacterized protein LOC134167755 isoform X3 [Pezoporus occidentalis]|uniref:uncharacterized protein LOC134167755 isoform X3 n=1 Tax=Pezoporus occidentalis TaxID=407982 RepID=UPI002F913760
MQAEEVQEDLCVLQERLAQCSAEAQRHKKLLGFVEKKQQYLREIVEQLSMENCEVVRCFQTNCRGLQQLEGHMARMKECLQMINREVATSLEEEQKRRQWSELAGAVLEQAEVKKLLRNRLKLLRQKCEGFQEPAASWTRRNKTISWLQRLCVFLLLLQIVTFVVLLTSDGLNWVLPPKLGAALGSCPARAWFF